MDIETKTTLKYLMETCKTTVDLKWKMNKFIDNGDLSFLGNTIKVLNERIDRAKTIEIVNSSDMIIGINGISCETAQKLKITKNKYIGDE